MKSILRISWQVFRQTGKTLTTNTLTDYMEQRGWSVLFYRDDAVTHTRLKELGCGKDSFSYQDDKLNLIGVRADKPERDTVFLLLHEIGHVLLGHRLDNLTVREEQQANGFAQSCLRYSRFSSRKLLACVAVVLLILALGLAGGSAIMRNRFGLPAVSRDVVTTEYGRRYHLPECQYVRNKTNTHTLTIEQAEQDGFTPCLVCRPAD